MPPIDKEEIEVALTKIEELHPLYRMPVTEVLPYLCCCFRNRKRKEDHTELIDIEKEQYNSAALIEDEIKDTDNRLNDIILNMAKASPYEGTNYVADEIAAMEEVRNQFKNPKQGSTDPFNGFGFGIIAYFKMLRFLLVTYAILTVCAGYIIHIYWQGDTIKAHDKKSFFAIFTVGNLGFTQTECTIWFQGLEKEQKLECSRGTISSIKHKGIIPGNRNMKFKSGERVPMDFCGSPELL